MKKSITSKNLSKQQVLEGRVDLSPFLVHLTRSGKVRLWNDIYGQRDNDRMIDAKDCLVSIIEKSIIKAVSPFGYFNFKVPLNFGTKLINPNSKVQRKWLRSVCFTETPVEHIHFQMSKISGRNLQFEPYGLAFLESSIRKKGGNPLFYFDSTNETMKASLDAFAVSSDCERFKNTLPLYESFGPSLYPPKREVDFRWEREWRVVGDVPFALDDVAFGICADEDIKFFEDLVKNKFPFVDPRGEIAFVNQKLKQRLKQ